MSTRFVAELDAEELAFRLLQIGVGVRAPPWVNATEGLNEAERGWPSGGPVGFPFRRMAKAALEYVGECVEKGQRVS